RHPEPDRVLRGPLVDGRAERGARRVLERRVAAALDPLLVRAGAVGGRPLPDVPRLIEGAERPAAVLEPADIDGAVLAGRVVVALADHEVVAPREEAPVLAAR